jgi:ribosome-binding protein aMBF1 (putative translation factor)
LAILIFTTMKTKSMQKARRHSSAIVEEIMASITPGEQNRTDNKMLIAVKIAEALKSKQISQKDFASKMGKVPSEINKWLSGTNNFTLDILSDIERALDIKLLNTQIDDASSNSSMTLQNSRRRSS